MAKSMKKGPRLELLRSVKNMRDIKAISTTMTSSTAIGMPYFSLLSLSRAGGSSITHSDTELIDKDLP